MAIENYTMQSGAHDFSLTFHSNHRPISHHFRDKRRYPSKIARKLLIFTTPRVFNAPVEGVPLGIVYRHRGLKKLELLGFQMVEKFSDRFSRFDTIPACNRHPASQPDTLP